MKRRLFLSATNICFAVCFAVVTVTFSGCSAKKEEFSKPADYWYQKMVREAAKGDLEAADATFTSLQSEHVRSILIPEAMQVLANAHIDKEEYLLANFYLDEYLKRYADKKNVEFVKFLKVKAGFLAFKYPLRDQQLLLDTVRDSEQFMVEYPNSVYRPLVETMVLKLSLANKMLNKNVAKLYDRLDKPKAVKIYKDAEAYSWTSKIEYEAPKIAWYRYLFELQ